MVAQIRSRLTYANVMATLAIFVALGGSGYAAVKINGKDIRNKSIAGKKLKDRTIAGKKLKDGAIAGRQVKQNSLTGANVNESTFTQVPSAADAGRLAGRSLAEVRAGIDATSLGGTPRSGFYSAAEVDERLSRTAEERSIGEQNFSAAAPLDRISVQLTAPRAGFAFVVASATIRPNATLVGQCVAQMNVPEIPQVGRIVGFEVGDGDRTYQVVTNTWIVPVTAGTQTFTLRLSINPNVSSGCTDTFVSSSSTLNAIWIP